MKNVTDAWNILQSSFNKTKRIDESNLVYNVKTDTFETNKNYKFKAKYHQIFVGWFSNRITFERFKEMYDDMKVKYSLYDAKEELSQSAFAKVCNGIGSNGFGGLVPDLKYRKCGNNHDLKYAIGNTKKDKKWADYCFLWEMKRVTPYSIIPIIYFLAVKFFGDFAFNFNEKYSIMDLNKKYKKEELPKYY